MRRVPIALLAALALAISASPASAAFGPLPGDEGLAVSLTKQDASAETRAGAHPDAMRVELGLATSGGFADGDLRNLTLALPPGLLLNPTVAEECSAAAFAMPRSSPFEASLSGERCPNQSQVGTVAVSSSLGTRHFGVFALAPPHGSPGALGFSPYGVPVVLRAQIRGADAGLDLALHNLSQSFDLQGLELEIWGTPWAADHDPERGNCLNELDPSAHHGDLSTPAGPGGSPPFKPGTCTIGTPAFLAENAKSYLTNPTTPCGTPLAFEASLASWQGAAAKANATAPALTDCNQSLTKAKVQLQSDRAALGTGLVFGLDVNDGGGILNPGGIARPAIRRAVVRLPEGLTINPSLAAGLGTCSPGDFAREVLGTAPGAGCPNASKVGEVRIEGMLGLPEPVLGSLFIATPHENPFGSLLALYVVARDPARGILVKSAGKVEPDPRTGRLTITFEDLPRLLYTRFEVSLHEGQRPMLISPPSCGAHATTVEMTSWAPADPPEVESSSFLITRGRDGGACPAPGAPPFSPGLTAGSLNPNANSYSPVYLRMTRADGEQAIVSYSAELPPGLLAKLAGVEVCPEAAIAAARGRSATEELAAPSCPPGSRIGATMVGGGVGATLAWAPGALYLAGPHNGSPRSVVAITAAKIGPFDLGTVVVRATPRFEPATARIFVDATRSDPIPHILAGIPIQVRDIRVHVDRPEFTRNPTGCNPTEFASILGGTGSDPFARGDDVLARSATPFQLLNCSALGFRPRLSMRLTGSTKRAGYPSLRAVYRPLPGDANVRTAAATLPKALFLEQAHIRNICSTVQFAAGACPPSSVYGYAKAFTPLLDEPLAGPVYLRTSNHRLPDLVADLHGLIDVEVAGRIGSRGGLHAVFENLPDAPVSKFVLRMKGGRKSLVVNSRELCGAPAWAAVELDAHNGRFHDLRPVLRTSCGTKERRDAKRRTPPHKTAGRADAAS